MKCFIALMICFVLLNFAIAQNKYGSLPYDYNSFVKNPDITWAIDTWLRHSFPDASINIHSYLINAQLNGNVKSFITSDYSKEFIKKWKKKKAGNFYIQASDSVNTKIADSIKNAISSMQFHEILYIQNHQLKTQIISAGSEYPVITSNGLFLGNSVISYSSLNFYQSKMNHKTDKIYFLGKTDTILNIDSLESLYSLKKTFGMNLFLNLWYDLSQGYNKLFDLNKNSVIPPKSIFKYAPVDSVEIFPDTILSYKVMVATDPVYTYLSNVEIVENWYFNKTQDFFYSTINYVYLFINYLDNISREYKTEKRFKVTFK